MYDDVISLPFTYKHTWERHIALTTDASMIDQRQYNTAIKVTLYSSKTTARLLNGMIR